MAMIILSESLLSTPRLAICFVCEKSGGSMKESRERMEIGSYEFLLNSFLITVKGPLQRVLASYYFAKMIKCLGSQSGNPVQRKNEKHGISPLF